MGIKESIVLGLQETYREYVEAYKTEISCTGFNDEGRFVLGVGYDTAKEKRRKLGKEVGRLLCQLEQIKEDAAQ